MRKRQKKQKPFAIEVVESLEKIGDKHGLCIEHTVKNTIIMLAGMVIKFDGLEELFNLIGTAEDMQEDEAKKTKKKRKK